MSFYLMVSLFPIQCEGKSSAGRTVMEAQGERGRYDVRGGGKGSLIETYNRLAGQC